MDLLGSIAASRIRRAAWLGLVLLVPAACGTGSGGNTTGDPLVGGTLLPNEAAYNATISSEAIAPLVDKSALPSHVDLRRDGIVPPVQNQRWNSCVAWSLGYYIMTAVHARLAREADIWLDVTQPDSWFSPDYLYSQRDDLDTRLRRAPDEPICVERDNELGCMRPERALSILVTQGCCRWDWLCELRETEEQRLQASDRYRSCDALDADFEQQKSRLAWALARPAADEFKARCYVRFGSLRELPIETVTDMHVWLHEQGTPIAIIVRMTQGWLKYRGENAVLYEAPDSDNFVCANRVEPRAVCLDAEGEDLGSQHMMTVIGYDNDFPSRRDYPDLPEEKRGSFLVVNQWGTKWGEDGYMWIPYSELAKIWIGGYGVIPERDGSQTQVAQCARNEKGQFISIVECDDVPENLDEDGAPERTATLLPDGQAVTDTVGAVISEGCASFDDFRPSGRDEVDWFYFETKQPRTNVRLSLMPLSGGAVRFELFDDEQRTIAGGNSSTRLLCRQGIYLVKVTPDSAGASEYELTVQHEGVAAPAEPDDLICDATPFEMNTIVSGTVGAGDDSDWWKLVAPETTLLSATYTGTDIDLEVFRGRTPDIREAVSGNQAAGTLRFPVVAGRCLYFRVSSTAVAPEAYTLRVDACPGLLNDVMPTRLELESSGTSVLGEHVAHPDTGIGGPCGSDAEDRFVLTLPGDNIDVSLQLSGTSVGASLDVSMSSNCDGRCLPEFILQDSNNDMREGESIADNLQWFLSKRELTIVVAANPGTSTSYDLRIDVTSGGEGLSDRPGNENDRTLFVSDAAARGAGVPTGAKHFGVVGGTDVDDYYFFNRQGDAVLVLTDFCQRPELVVDLGGGNLVPLTDAGSSEWIVAKKLVGPGTYAGVVSPASRAGDLSPMGRTVYTLQAYETPTLPQGNDTPPKADELAIDSTHSETVGEDDRHDYFRVPNDSPQARRVSLELVSTSGAPGIGLQVWGAEGIRSTAGTDEVVTFVVGPGEDLIVLVAGEPDASSTYLLRATSD